MKYPYILFFRYKKYSYVDSFIIENKDKFNCSFYITHKKIDLNKLFDININLLVTFGEKDSEYANDINTMVPERIKKRWLHFENIQDNLMFHYFNCSVNFSYLDYITNKELLYPQFSLFTTCYNSYEKIIRAYKSIHSQTLIDWEWVILDDSPNDEHFSFLKKTLEHDNRIRLYKRSENNGNIGNVKNEVVSLCRGKYILEMDHDDEILPDVLLDSVKIFESDSEIGFIFMNYTNIYENKTNFKYGDLFSLGYAGYYMEKYHGKWVYVSSSPNINNVTLGHIVSVPNHPRIWRKSSILQIGNYCEALPILDDYELLLRTAVNTKIVKLSKLGYIQYMNNNNNNFSLIRNSEINRIIWDLKRVCYDKYKISENMKLKDAFEDEKFIYESSQIWKRNDYEHKFCNKIINLEYKKQFCILGMNTFMNNFNEISELYKDQTNDFILLDNNLNNDNLCEFLDKNNFIRMKCYSMTDCSWDELKKYFLLIYKSCDNYHIYT